MKRILTLIYLTGIALPLLGQSSGSVTSVDASAAKAFYATDEWNKAFMGYFGVNPGVEPGVPEDQAEREVLGQIRDLLQSGTDQSTRAAVQAIEALIRQQQAEGLTTSPMMLQIAGTLEMRNAETTSNEQERERVLRRAESYLKRAVDSQTGFPNFLRAHKNLANLLFRMDRSKEAKQHFVKAVELGDRDAVTFGLLGAIYMEEGKLVAAETSLRNSLMIKPDILEFKQLLGNVLLQQERYAEAKEVFAELLLRRPNEVNFWMAQSNCYIALEEIDQATRNLEIVRFMGKANVPSLMLLGDVYINKDMIDEATEVYLEAIEMNPSSSNLGNFIRSAETLNNYAAYDQGMRVIEAIKGAYAGELSDQQEIELLSLQSEINISLGKGAEAADNLEDLIRKDPFNARALLSLARYYGDLEPDENLPIEERDLIERRNQQQAIIYYERAQELDDERAQVRAFIGEAQLRVQRDELQDAADLLEEAQSISYQDNVQSYLDQIRAALKNRRRS